MDGLESSGVQDGDCDVLENIKYLMMEQMQGFIFYEEQTVIYCSLNDKE